MTELSNINISHKIERLSETTETGEADPTLLDSASEHGSEDNYTAPTGQNPQEINNVSAETNIQKDIAISTPPVLPEISTPPILPEIEIIGTSKKTPVLDSPLPEKEITEIQPSLPGLQTYKTDRNIQTVNLDDDIIPISPIGLQNKFLLGNRP